MSIAKTAALRIAGAKSFDPADIEEWRNGWRVVQVPVTYTPRTKGQGKKLRASASFDVLRAILRVRFGG